MDRTDAMIRGLLILTAIVAVVLWLLFYSLKKSDDPARLIVKWVVTLIVVGLLIATVTPGVGRITGERSLPRQPDHANQPLEFRPPSIDR